MACEECRELTEHAFRSPADLLHALQLASGEVERGVLQPITKASPNDEERWEVKQLTGFDPPAGEVRYRFQCTVCGDLFELRADMSEGTGEWLRNPVPGDAA